MIWRTLFVVIAFVLLSAHFLRGGHILITAVCLAAPLLLLIRRRWTRLAIQSALYAGAAVWLYTGYVLAQERLAAQQPWARMMVILISVATVTIAAGRTLNSTTAKTRYP